jgi:hypothetical protein
MEDSIQSRTAPPKRNPDHPDGRQAVTVRRCTDCRQPFSATARNYLCRGCRREYDKARRAEWDVNYYLIAAAPDLYAALKLIAEAQIPSQLEDVLQRAGTMREIARAALAKARGEQP